MFTVIWYTPSLRSRTFNSFTQAQRWAENVHGEIVA